jgi:hypothetical protein
MAIDENAIGTILVSSANAGPPTRLSPLYHTFPGLSNIFVIIYIMQLKVDKMKSVWYNAPQSRRIGEMSEQYMMSITDNLTRSRPEEPDYPPG